MRPLKLRLARQAHISLLIVERIPKRPLVSSVNWAIGSAAPATASGLAGSALQRKLTEFGKFAAHGELAPVVCRIFTILLSISRSTRPKFGLQQAW
jgi:hypothetical protein